MDEAIRLHHVLNRINAVKTCSILINMSSFSNCIKEGYTKHYFSCIVYTTVVTRFGTWIRYLMSYVVEVSI